MIIMKILKVIMSIKSLNNAVLAPYQYRQFQTAFDNNVVLLYALLEQLKIMVTMVIKS